MRPTGTGRLGAATATTRSPPHERSPRRRADGVRPLDGRGRAADGRPSRSRPVRHDRDLRADRVRPRRRSTAPASPSHRWSWAPVAAVRRSTRSRRRIANYASKPPMMNFDPDVLRLYVAHGFRPSPEGVRLKCDPEHEARTFENGGLHRTWDLLPEITTRVVVVTGVVDGSGPAAIAEAIADRLPNSIFLPTPVRPLRPVRRPGADGGADRRSRRHRLRPGGPPPVRQVAACADQRRDGAGAAVPPPPSAPRSASCRRRCRSRARRRSPPWPTTSARWSPSDRAIERGDRPFVERPFLDLDDAGGVGENELDVPVVRHPPEAGFGVQRTAVVGRSRALVVREERLTDMGEGDRLVVVERLDRGIHAVAATGPRAEQEPQRLDVGMDRRPSHLPATAQSLRLTGAPRRRSGPPRGSVPSRRPVGG